MAFLNKNAKIITLLRPVGVGVLIQLMGFGQCSQWERRSQSNLLSGAFGVNSVYFGCFHS